MQSRYKYRAADAAGRTREGVLLADSREQVLEHLAGQQLVPIRVAAVAGRRGFSLLSFFSGPHYERLIAFTANLGTMYRAGVPLLRALALIRIGPAAGHFNRAIDDIRLAVQAGRPLSQAMAAHDDLFARAYVAGVAAGEESGKLDEILAQLRTMLEQDLELSRAVKAGTRYPLMVVGALGAAALVLVLYVVPRFTAFYGQFNAQLPLPTRLLIGLQHTVSAYWPALLMALVLAALAVRQAIGTERGKSWLDHRLLRLPIVGPLIIKSNVARFAAMFHVLFQAGLPIIACLEILAETVKNSALAGEIRTMAGLFREGRDSRLAEHEFRYFPPLALQMMTIGLESGSLAEVLREVGEHYGKEVQYTSRQLTAVLEPILTFVMGIFVLILALAIFLPMWNLIRVFNG
ncbi:MAG TPA: type II secretion system F family protein [candidate division Zixibacteria bacterium]|nr:type II secretion system F family protein [candidate division Zixibacteria bacterium]MDD4918613.1 type II secretion system F family protein [candidate division Zixibacteria bacterium]MDM7974304.1 type II secretion system F family protein [candidate division Zixibacteria bacterium]HOD66274.1 type II secretion system F family protein [candidate division Zixibacteria bacterium]HOZ08147.1 type II secretion system F family protein [candidate division Zixibacteria bacterium]